MYVYGRPYQMDEIESDMPDSTGASGNLGRVSESISRKAVTFWSLGALGILFLAFICWGANPPWPTKDTVNPNSEDRSELESRVAREIRMIENFSPADLKASLSNATIEERIYSFLRKSDVSTPIPSYPQVPDKSADMYHNRQKLSATLPPVDLKKELESPPSKWRLKFYEEVVSSLVN